MVDKLDESKMHFIRMLRARNSSHDVQHLWIKQTTIMKEGSTGRHNIIRQCHEGTGESTHDATTLYGAYKNFARNSPCRREQRPVRYHLWIAPLGPVSIAKRAEDAGKK